jgi:hypothetical protein
MLRDRQQGVSGAVTTVNNTKEVVVRARGQLLLVALVVTLQATASGVFAPDTAKAGYCTGWFYAPNNHAPDPWNFKGRSNLQFCTADIVSSTLDHALFDYSQGGGTSAIIGGNPLYDHTLRLYCDPGWHEVYQSATVLIWDVYGRSGTDSGNPGGWIYCQGDPGGKPTFSMPAPTALGMVTASSGSDEPVYASTG